MTTAHKPTQEALHAVVYPLRPDGLLVDAPRFGRVTSWRSDTIELCLDGFAELHGRQVVIGIEQPGRAIGYLGAVLVADAAGENSRQIRAVPGGIGGQVLAEEGCVPVLSEADFRYQRAFADEVYASWQQAGILRPMVLDKILVCPKCQALPTFRFGCQRCRSGRLEQAVLVHHFACAFVAPLAAFSGEKSLQCPKCQTKHLIAGTDFEYAPGEHHCLDCGWKSRELSQVGHCLRCETRFPLHQALEQELDGYDVNRVDAMAVSAYVG